jgi:hypothetical protein
MSRIRKLYKKMRHIHLRLRDNGADCDLTQPLAWLYAALEHDEPLNTQFIAELEYLAATCASEYRPDIEHLLAKAQQLASD